MKKEFMIVVITTILVFVTTSCKKEQEQNTPNRPLSQFVPQGKEAISRIVTFRDRFLEYKKNPSVRTEETISLVDAVWSIENTFNVTYAMPEEYYSETADFAFALSLPIDSVRCVAVSDLFAVYEQVLSGARTAYANDGFTNKGFAFLFVKPGDQNDGSIQLLIRGKTGERMTHPIYFPHDSAMFVGPFDTTDYWHYANGMGKCDNTYLWSGADKEIEKYLEAFLRYTLTTPETGTRSLYINPVTIQFDGADKPNDVFYRENVNATCIDFNNMNRLYQREKRLIFETLPCDSTGSVFGYIPIIIEIDGVLKTNQVIESYYITHQNILIYAQRLVADIDVVGEIQDLLDY